MLANHLAPRATPAAKRGGRWSNRGRRCGAIDTLVPPSYIAARHGPREMMCRRAAHRANGGPRFHTTLEICRLPAREARGFFGVVLRARTPANGPATRRFFIVRRQDRKSVV